MKYTKETYDELIRQSYCDVSDEYINSEANQNLKSLYENNYLNGSGENKIPKIIHQVWIGGELPERYRGYSRSWILKHPGWEYRLWTENDVESFGLERRSLYYSSKNNGQKSDIFRYEILRRYGGLYIDTDFECLKSFDDLMYLNFFTSIGYETKVELYIGLIATVPHHPIIERCVKDMRNIPKEKGFIHIFNSTGSYHFTRCFKKEVTKDTKGVVAFPMGFFYPWPNNKRKYNNAYSHIKPYSYAVHHWAVSWTTAKN